MNVDAIVLSEWATLTDGGRSLTIVRTFNLATGPELPIGLPTICISLLIHAHHDEAGSTHHGEIRLINARREQVAIVSQFEFTFTGSEGLHPGLPLRHNVVARVLGPRFNEVGPYAFEVYIDGIYHAGAVFNVMLTEPAK